MNLKSVTLAAILLTCLSTVFPRPAAAQLSVGANTNVIAIGQILIGNDIAYDPDHDIYLSVAAYGPVYGVFVSPSGGAAGPPFRIGSASSSSFGHYPRTIYSRELGGFLVAWHQDGWLHSLVVSSPSGTMSADRLISDGSQTGTRASGNIGLAYSYTSHKFLATWTTNAFGVQGRFLDSSGVPSGLVMQYVDAGTNPGAQEPQLAWNSATDEFGLVYGAFNSSAAWVGFKRVPASGAPPSAPTTFGFAAGVFSPSISINTSTSHYIVGWSIGGGAKGTEFDQSGNKVADDRFVASRLGTPTSFELAYNPVSNTFLAVSEDPKSVEVAGIELNPDGSPIGIAVGLSSGASSGSFVPRLAARTNAREWSISYTRNMNALANQVVSTATTGSGGGGGGGGGSPGPTCTTTINDTSTAITGAAYTGALSVGTAPGCDWFAVPKASWLTVSPGSGSGSGSFQWTAQANSTGAARSGTILIATATTSQFLTIYQSALTSCTIAINDNSTAILAATYTGALTVSTPGGCDWFAIPQVPWLSVSKPGASGPGSFTWTAQANTGAPRTGTILVASAIASVYLTVRQAGVTARLGDFNGDSRVDLMWQNMSNGTLSYWKMSGFNVISGESVTPSAVADTGWKIVATLDIDKDGSTDLLWQHDSGYVSVWRMRGSTQVSGDVITPTPLVDTRWRVVGCGDFNRDGDTDIVWQHQDGRVAVWYMHGLSNISGEVIASPLADQGWRVVGVADMNRDGSPDLVWHHTITGQVAVWLMNGTNAADTRLLDGQPPDTNWHVRGLADYDDDGDIDIIWQNDVTGELAAWVMNGLSVQTGMYLAASVSDTNWKIVGPR